MLLMMMTQRKYFNYIFLMMTLMIVFITCTNSLPLSSMNDYSNSLENVPDDVLMELLAGLEQSILRARNDVENSKRSFDFGSSRGRSGTYEALHRIGSKLADTPVGPGRRRRSEFNV